MMSRNGRLQKNGTTTRTIFLLLNPSGQRKETYYAGNFTTIRGCRWWISFTQSRGCRFDCYPCCVSFLGGRKFRPRPISRVVEELEAIDNNRLFMVDNSLAQDKDWERELFTAMIPLKKKWCCHPIEDDDEILDLAARAGAWYV